MKKTGLLNAPVSAVIAEMGHTDSLCIADAGLPIHQTAENGRIDLALAESIPRFVDVLRSLLGELAVERIVLAEEIKKFNPQVQAEIISIFQEIASERVPQIDYVPHETFKAMTHKCKAVVRSGECSPYANIILFSGVVF